jgi:hypothetical protein
LVTYSFRKIEQKMKGIFNTFSSENTNTRQHAETKKAVKQTVNQFIKITETIGKQVPAASYLNLELLSKVIYKQLAETPNQRSLEVTHEINADGSIRFQHQELHYLLHTGKQGVLGSDGQLVEGIVTHPNGKTEEGRFAYVPELRATRLVKGKRTTSNGNVNVGRFAYIPGLRDTELLKGKKTTSSGYINEGRWAYSPELNEIYLAKGKTTSPSGYINEGRWAYSPELNRMYLAKGKTISPSGYINDGRWAYIPELRDVRLVEGTSFSNGTIKIGEFIYEPTPNLIRLVNGSVTHVDGKTETGTFSYIPQLQRNELTNGRIEKGNNWQEGSRSYIPELGRMHLTEGTIHKNGVTKVGTWIYDRTLANGAGGMLFIPPHVAQVEIPAAQKQLNSDLISTITNMTNTFGDSKATSNLNNLLNAWELLNQTTTNQAYAEKVDQLSEAYHQCKRTLLICVHPDRGGATETAQQYLEPLQNLGRSINNAINTLRNGEPNFV